MSEGTIIVALSWIPTILVLMNLSVMSEGTIIVALIGALVMVFGITFMVDDGVSGDAISTIRCGDGEITLNNGTVLPLPDHLKDDFQSMSYVEFTNALHQSGVVTYADLNNCDHIREEDVNHE